MGRKTVLLDDYDGAELPDDAQPVNLSLGRTTYALYLSEKNHGKLLEALNPFIENAETVSAAVGVPRRAGGTPAPVSSADKERNKAVRAWAQASGFKFKNVAGEETTLGDRGRIPQEVYDAYDAAN